MDAPKWDRSSAYLQGAPPHRIHPFLKWICFHLIGFGSLNEKNSESLLRAGIDGLFISFDAVNPKDYENQRVGATLGRTIDNLYRFVKLRNKTLILVGFGGGFRRTELISIDYEDLEFVDEGVKIVLRRSKTDQFGEGMIKGLPYFSKEAYCPVTNLKKWLKISKIKTGPIFRRFAKGSALTQYRLTDQSVVLIIKNCLKLAGIENNNFSGHSLRSGFATVAAESGADERSIMAMTGHKTTQMVRRYIRDANIFKNNALSKIKLWILLKKFIIKNIQKNPIP